MNKKYASHVADEHLDLIIESQKERNASLLSFFKTLTPIMVGLLGLLIGLKSSDELRLTSKYLFLASITLIGFCILFSLIVQFGEVSFRRKYDKKLKKQIYTYAATKDASSLVLEGVNRGRIYKISEYGTFFCLLLAITTLILYVFSLDFYFSIA